MHSVSLSTIFDSSVNVLGPANLDIWKRGQAAGICSSKDPNRKLKHRYLGTLLIVSRRQNDSRTSPVMLYIRSTTTPSWAIYLLSTKSWNHFRNSNLISMLLHIYQIFRSKKCLSMYFFVCPLFLHIFHATFSFRLFMIMSTLPIIYLEFFRRSMYRVFHLILRDFEDLGGQLRTTFRL